jgi:ribose-phosphate pyrophosphokinase
MDNDLCIFALDTSHSLAGRISEHMGLALSEHEERTFSDGEHKCRPMENVRGKDVFVVQSLFQDKRHSVNDKLCRLLFFIGALHDASAASITAVLPYMAYARKDRQTKPRDPVTTRYMANLFAAVGTDRVVALDIHNLSAFQNAFNCHTDHLSAEQLFVDYFAARITPTEQVVVLAPDAGASKRAELFKQRLARRLNTELTSAFISKQRSAGTVAGSSICGTVTDRTVIIYDDMICSGTTISRALAGCTENRAAHVYAAATHGAFTDTANELFVNAALEQVVVTDSVASPALAHTQVGNKLVVLDIAPLFAEAIRRIHNGDSVVELLAD